MKIKVVKQAKRKKDAAIEWDNISTCHCLYIAPLLQFVSRLVSFLCDQSVSDMYGKLDNLGKCNIYFKCNV